MEGHVPCPSAQPQDYGATFPDQIDRPLSHQPYQLLANSSDQLKKNSPMQPPTSSLPLHSHTLRRPTSFTSHLCTTHQLANLPIHLTPPSPPLPTTYPTLVPISCLRQPFLSPNHATLSIITIPCTTPPIHFAAYDHLPPRHLQSPNSQTHSSHPCYHQINSPPSPSNPHISTVTLPLTPSHLRHLALRPSPPTHFFPPSPFRKSRPQYTSPNLSANAQPLCF